MVDISFIVLAWNSSRFLTKCFAAIIGKCQRENVTFEIIVIDNGSTDDSKAIYAEFGKYHPEQFFVEYLGRNTGTTYSRNIGIKKARGQYLCILDSDTELRRGELKSVFDRLKQDPEIGLIVPRLLLADDFIQPSVKKFPTFFDKLLKIPQLVLGIKSPNNDFYADFPFQVEREVDTAISACWIFRRELIDQIGYLDEQIFYAPEDLDFCVRISKAGLKVLYWPDMEIFHDTQWISHRKPFSKVSRSHFFGLIYYFRKHGGWFSNSHLYR